MSALRSVAVGRLTRRLTSVAALSLALAPFVPFHAAAQDAASPTVGGRVTSEGGAPISDAIVTLRRLRLSTRTNDVGVYRIVIPAGQVAGGVDTLRVIRLGYAPVERVVTLTSGTNTVDVSMRTEAVSLDQIVVTGTAGNQERKAQSAVVASINAADLTAKAPIANVNEMLTGREPGVSLTQGSGTSGANSRIDIRGQASISLSNDPLIFIDGVRVSAGKRTVAQAPGGTTSGAGGQTFSALNDLNIDEIESIEVVKGPAASTLYGADASAGVIQILTKKGRAGAQSFSQRVMAQYDMIHPNFTPLPNYATCGAAQVVPTSTAVLCHDNAVGTIVSDNPVERMGAFSRGSANQLQYNVQGSGESFGYFGALSALNETGTTAGSSLNHRTGRLNLNWAIKDKFHVEALVGMSRSKDQLPQGDQSTYGYLINGFLGSPLTVRRDASGNLAGGLLNNNLNLEAIRSIKTEVGALRLTPSVQLRYQPVDWFSSRIVFGGDFVRTTQFQQFPKNDKNWYSTIANTGSVARTEGNNTIYTVDYLGNINRRFGRDGWISSDLSFGTQWISTVSELLSASGSGLLINPNYLVTGATTISAGEGYGESKSFGILAQEQIGFNDRLFLQFGLRADRSSAFGSKVGTFYLPKVGFSWVLSQEPVTRRVLPDAISTFRIRASYGQTGRSPSSTAMLQTYSRSNYITDAGIVMPGVSPGNPGNPNLKPERGVEVEAGFDAGFFNDRVGLEATYFAKTSRDLLLQAPIAPSAVYSSSPWVNIGEMTNKGVEIALRASVISRRNLKWDANLSVATLANKVVDMGGIAPIVGADNQCVKPGIPVSAWCGQAFIGPDASGTKALVTDTAVVLGTKFPKVTPQFSTSFTLFQNLRLYAQADGKFGHRIYNLTDDLRDRSMANSEKAVRPADQGGYTADERFRRYGPFVNSAGMPVGATLVRGDYIQPGDFVRFRELSATLTLPASLAQRFGASSSSLSVGGRNLALWTRYGGYDPEVFGVVDPILPYLAEVFTTPQSRRAFVRLNFQF